MIFFSFILVDSFLFLPTTTILFRCWLSTRKKFFFRKCYLLPPMTKFSAHTKSFSHRYMLIHTCDEGNYFFSWLPKNLSFSRGFQHVKFIFHTRVQCIFNLFLIYISSRTFFSLLLCDKRQRRWDIFSQFFYFLLVAQNALI